MTLASAPSRATDLVRVAVVPHRFERSFEERVLVVCGVEIRPADLRDRPDVIAERIRAAMAKMEAE